MDRRRAWGLLGGLALAPAASLAQPRENVPRVVGLGFGDWSTQNLRLMAAFRQGLRDLGYTEGSNIRLKYFMENSTELLVARALEIVRSEPNVIVGAPTICVLALRRFTSGILVQLTGVDPVGAGLAGTLAHPGGNVTGLTNQVEGVVAKNLETLRILVPQARNAGLVMSAENSNRIGFYSDAHAAAQQLGFRVVEVPVASTAIVDTPPIWEKLRCDALCFAPDSVLFYMRQQIVAAVAVSRVPAVYPYREFAEIGGLMSYGADLSDQVRRGAAYVGKILKNGGSTMRSSLSRLDDGRASFRRRSNRYGVGL